MELKDRCIVFFVYIILYLPRRVPYIFKWKHLNIGPSGGFKQSTHPYKNAKDNHVRTFPTFNVKLQPKIKVKNNKNTF